MHRARTNAKRAGSGRSNPWPFSREPEPKAAKRSRSALTIGAASREAKAAGYRGRESFGNWLERKHLDDRGRLVVDRLSAAYRAGVDERERDEGLKERASEAKREAGRRRSEERLERAQKRKAAAPTAAGRAEKLESIDEAALEEHFKRGGTLSSFLNNPGGYRGMSVAKLEQIRPFVNARVYDNDWLVRDSARRELAELDKSLANARKREAKKGMRNPSIFDYEDAQRAGRKQGEQTPIHIAPAMIRKFFATWWKYEGAPLADPKDRAGNFREYNRFFREAMPRSPRRRNPSSTAAETIADFKRQGKELGRKDARAEYPHFRDPNEAATQGAFMAQTSVEYHGFPATRERELADAFSQAYYDAWRRGGLRKPARRSNAGPEIGGRPFRPRPAYEEQVDALNERISRTRSPKQLAALMKRRDAIGRKATAEFRKNPADEAIEGFREFHGKEPDELVRVKRREHYHRYLSGAGKLERLVVASVDGEHEVTLTRFGGALLAFNEDKNQLFIEGGDQSVKLADFGIDEPHELETLGEVVFIGYDADKKHLGDEGGKAVYLHRFRTTNENGKHVIVEVAKYPDLIYRVLDEHLEFSGGSYRIIPEGIDR